MEQHKHAELLKIWDDHQDSVSFQCEEGEYWTTVDVDLLIHKPDKYVYRINPRCKYAINKIRELGGYTAVEVYKHWLDGGDIEVDDNGGGFYIPFSEENRKNDIFGSFIFRLKYNAVFRKKQTKEVLWISDSNTTSIPQSGNKVLADWFAEGVDPNSPHINFTWHKVPTCTR